MRTFFSAGDHILQITGVLIVVAAAVLSIATG